MEERVQKIIAAAGIMSRRAAEQLILDGRVKVNGVLVTELGTKADPERDHIKVDGKLINPAQPRAYIMLNKPVGFVTTMSDPEGRPVVSDLLKGVKARVFPVGRLDYNTEGMLLLTNDGDFAHLITHPKHELPKSYLVKVKGILSDAQIENLESGVFLKDGKTAPAKVRKLRKEEANSWIEITIHEGRKRQVRRMIDHTGHSVIKLRRVRVGSVNLGDLPLGAYRYLTTEEISALKEAAQREQSTWSVARSEVSSAQAAERPAKRAPRARREPEPLGDRDQKALDSWASEAAKRRKQEREGKKTRSAPRRYGAGEASLAAGKERTGFSERTRGISPRGPRQEKERGSSGPSWGRKPGFGDREKGSYSRGPKQDRERSASGPSWGRKPGFGDREKGSYSRGPKQDRERSASGPSRGRKPGFGDREKGSYSRGPKPDRERSASGPSWGRKPGFGDREKGLYSRGPKPDRERSASGPSWGRKPGFGDREKGSYTRGPKPDSSRAGARPAGGKKPGQGGRSFSSSAAPAKRSAGSRAPRSTGDRKPRGRKG